MQRRNLLFALCAVPLVTQDIKHPTEAQLVGVTEEEYAEATKPSDPSKHVCPVCMMEFDPLTAVVVDSDEPVCACPGCGVCQTMRQGEGETP